MVAVLASIVVLLISALCLVIGWRQGAWALTGLGLLVLVALPLSVVVLGLVAAATGLGAVYASHVQKTRDPGRHLRAVQQQAAARRRDIAELTRFARAAAAVQTQTTLRTHETDLLVAEQYLRSRRRLQSLGQLTPAVDAELDAIRTASVTTVISLTREVTQSLQRLVQTYRPRRAPGSFFGVGEAQRFGT